jgi:ABC-2 type transport system permease protein
MLRSLKVTWLFAKLQLTRSLRDPITTIVLFGIPVLLVLVFGSITRGGDNLSVDVAVINNSQTQFAKDFEKSLGSIKALKINDEGLSLDKARDKMNDDSLDGIIELPKDFGTIQDNLPKGNVKVYFDKADTQTGDIVASIIQGAVNQTNQQLVETPVPISIERTPIKVSEASAFDTIFSIFTGMAIMMVGVFAVGSIFPADKKSGVMRRMHVTPIKAREIIGGTMLSFAVIGLIGVGILTLIALLLFDFNMRGDWLQFGAFVLLSLFTMLGFGLAIGGVAKNTTQSDIMGQIVFLASLAVSGVWFPRVLMPEWLQGITSFFPLTPIIDGIRSITTENASLITIWPEVAVIAGWGIVVYIVGVKLFKWN